MNKDTSTVHKHYFDATKLNKENRIHLKFQFSPHSKCELWGFHPFLLIAVALANVSTMVIDLFVLQSLTHSVVIKPYNLRILSALNLLDLQVVAVTDQKEHDLAKTALFTRHPAMKYWPKDHGKYVVCIIADV